ncbi:CDPK-related kinase 3 isoform X2 [Tanacetum coccineum]
MYVGRLCEGGELLDRILSRGGRYIEKDAKSIVMQILSVAAFTHLQGVVHRDLKPERAKPPGVMGHMLPYDFLKGVSCLMTSTPVPFGNNFHYNNGAI